MEVFQDCREAREDLFALVRACWAEEQTPESITAGVFIPIWNENNMCGLQKYICGLSAVVFVFKMLKDSVWGESCVIFSKVVDFIGEKWGDPKKC